MNHSPVTPADLDPRFLNPSESLLVICESTELHIDEVRLALEGLAWLGECAANANAKLATTAQWSPQFMELPPDCFAALMRMMSEKVGMAGNNPSLSSVLAARPDLCTNQNGGV